MMRTFVASKATRLPDAQAAFAVRQHTALGIGPIRAYRHGVWRQSGTVTYRRHSKHSPARLWRAITDPDEIAAWMGAPASVDLRFGGNYGFDFHGNGEDGLDGIIVRVERERRLGYVWGWSYVEWEIESAGDGCRYTFIQNGLTDRGDDEEGLPAGWHEFFERLDDHLKGAARTADQHAARWKALKPYYRTQIDAVIRGDAQEAAD